MLTATLPRLHTRGIIIAWPPVLGCSLCPLAAASLCVMLSPLMRCVRSLFSNCSAFKDYIRHQDMDLPAAV